MIIANIEPLMKEIQESKDKSIFEEDISMCFVLSVLEKYFRDIPKVEIDTQSIETRVDNEVDNEPDELQALNNLGMIYNDIMKALKTLTETE